MNAHNGESDKPLLDDTVIESLRELGGQEDPGLVLELIEMFLEDAPQRLEEMRLGLESGDLGLVQRSAHTLKSSAANMGATVFSTLCREIEECARACEPEGLGDRAESCFAVFDRTRTALQQVR